MRRRLIRFITCGVETRPKAMLNKLMAQGEETGQDCESVSTCLPASVGNASRRTGQPAHAWRLGDGYPRRRAASTPRNVRSERDLGMWQAQKGDQWSFGMKARKPIPLRPRWQARGVLAGLGRRNVPQVWFEVSLSGPERPWTVAWGTRAAQTHTSSSRNE